MEYQSLIHIPHDFGRKITQFLEEAGLINRAGLVDHHF
jgi:hypothetical protein